MTSNEAERILENLVKEQDFAKIRQIANLTWSACKDSILRALSDEAGCDIDPSIEPSIEWAYRIGFKDGMVADRTLNEMMAQEEDRRHEV